MNNFVNVLVILVLVVLCIFAIIEIRKGKGKCAYCSHADTCPFKNKKK